MGQVCCSRAVDLKCGISEGTHCEAARGKLQDSCQRRAGDLPLSILRVGFTCAPLRRLPLGSTLLEDLVHSLLLSQPAVANLPAAASAMPSATNGGAVARERSYTEQTTVESAELPAAVSIPLHPMACFWQWKICSYPHNEIFPAC